MLTAKHVACARYIRKKNDRRNVYPMEDTECTDPKRRVEVKIGKTKNPKGEGFDFTVQAQVVDVGHFTEYGENGDWAVLKIIGKTPRQKNFPKPIQTLLADYYEDYRGLKVVSAGYPAYGNSTKLYADWDCRSHSASFGIGTTNCEIDKGFSGGPILANLDGNGVAQIGINTSGKSGRIDGHLKQFTGGIVSFELSNGDDEGEVTEAAKIRAAMGKITCD